MFTGIETARATRATTNRRLVHPNRKRRDDRHRMPKQRRNVPIRQPRTRSRSAPRAAFIIEPEQQGCCSRQRQESPLFGVVHRQNPRVNTKNSLAEPNVEPPAWIHSGHSCSLKGLNLTRGRRPPPPPHDDSWESRGFESSPPSRPTCPLRGVALMSGLTRAHCHDMLTTSYASIVR